MSLLPERLVAIKHGPSAAEAEEDQRRLNEAGIPNYLGWDGLFERHELKVPEGEVQAAIEILGIEKPRLDTPRPLHDETTDDKTNRCPQCHDSQSRALPPYLLIGGILGTPVIFFLAYLCIFRLGPVFGGLVVAGWVSLLYWLAPRIPKWECCRCGHRWTTFPPYPIRFT